MVALRLVEEGTHVFAEVSPLLLDGDEDFAHHSFIND